MQILGFKGDLAVKLLNYHLADHQSQADTCCVKLFLCVLDGAKQFEQLRLVFLLDAYARISHEDSYQIIGFDFCLYLNTSITISEFDSIGQQIQKHLLQTFFVSVNKVIVDKTNDSDF